MKYFCVWKKYFTESYNYWPFIVSDVLLLKALQMKENLLIPNQLEGRSKLIEKYHHDMDCKSNFTERQKDFYHSSEFFFELTRIDSIYGFQKTVSTILSWTSNRWFHPLLLKSLVVQFTTKLNSIVLFFQFHLLNSSYDVTLASLIWFIDYQARKFNLKFLWMFTEFNNVVSFK